MENTKNRIKSIVEAYKRNNQEEYKLFCDANKAFKRTIRDDYASSDGQVTGRLLLETPETLYLTLLNELEPDELMYFKSSSGARWFAKTFKEMAVPDKI